MNLLVDLQIHLYAKVSNIKTILKFPLSKVRLGNDCEGKLWKSRPVLEDEKGFQIKLHSCRKQQKGKAKLSYDCSGAAGRFTCHRSNAPFHYTQLMHKQSHFENKCCGQIKLQLSFLPTITKGVIGINKRNSIGLKEHITNCYAGCGNTILRICMAASGKGNIVQREERRDSTTYEKILDANVLQSVKKVKLKRG